MYIRVITSMNREWEKVIKYANGCSWSAGRNLAELMKNESFKEWERVLIAVDNDEIAGYCTVSKTDCIPNLDYTPYIGFVFVGEKHRGHRVSEKLIKKAMEYLKSLNFEKVYIISDHINFYEKYGFNIVDIKRAPWGEEEKIYMKEL